MLVCWIQNRDSDHVLLRSKMASSTQPENVPSHFLCDALKPDNMRYSFGKKKRVTRSGDFTKIIRLGTCVADGTLVLFALPKTSADNSIRIGITIPKKTGNAVQRNRWKRLIRESFRVQQAALPVGYEFIVRPKRGATPSWRAIEKSIPHLAHKAAKRARHPDSNA